MITAMGIAQFSERTLSNATHLMSVLQTQADGTGFWMPVDASTTAGEVDWIFHFILWLSVFFFTLIIVVSTLFVVKYKARAGQKASHTPHHNMTLELAWTIVPLVLVLVIFYFGFKAYLNMSIAPDNAYEIQVTGRKWSWMFTYPDGTVDADLHVPVDTPISLVLSSDDVIHSLFIPAFRLKKDAVPGMYNKAWFQATEPGEYEILCAEYCGTEHSTMIAKVVVHEPGGFDAWLKDAANFLGRVSPVEAGEKLAKTRGCAQCHTSDGSALIGPSFKDLYGEKVVFKDGTNTIADENYLREAILDPMVKVVAGFEAVMPTYQGKLNDREIIAVIQYIKSLSATHKSEVMTAWESESDSDDESAKSPTDIAIPTNESEADEGDSETSDTAEKTG